MKKDTAKKVCLYLDKKVVKKAKLYCVKHNITMSKNVEDLLKEQQK